MRTKQKDALQRVQAANDGTVRLGHMYWIRDVLDGRIMGQRCPRWVRRRTLPFQCVRMSAFHTFAATRDTDAKANWWRPIERWKRVRVETARCA